MRRDRLNPASRAGVTALALGVIAAIFPGFAAADSSEDFPIPRRIIRTTCTAEQILAAARDYVPVDYDRYITDFHNHPNQQEAVVDKAHWFFSLTPAERRNYSEHLYEGGLASPDPLTLAWVNNFNIFFNDKGVVAKETEHCEQYPPNDMSVWDW